MDDYLSNLKVGVMLLQRGILEVLTVELDSERFHHLLCLLYLIGLCFGCCINLNVSYIVGIGKR